MSEIFTVAVLVAVTASAIRLAVPLLLASLGETFGQRSGVLNLGVDGIMLIGAFTGYYAVLKSGNVWLGLLAGAMVGLALGFASAVIAVTLQAKQGISGIGIYLFGLGMSDLLFQKLVGTPIPINTFPKINVPILSEIPYLGPMLFRHSLIIYLAFAAIPISMFIINRTTFGMNIRAVGEYPEAADTLGVSVTGVRYATQLIGGTLAGMAGGTLAISLGIFQQNLTNGAGFIAIALVYFGAWRPVGIMLGALLFGFVNALVLELKTLEIIPRDLSNLAAMAPAVITILALAFVARRFRAPAALTKPFTRGQ
ncbi:MAG: ABC transporter permease [Actinomycetota bacterium]|nr:ABC transporter permease [Actinomycetota bacterium]MDK1017688.1 ABC transporter permease [Actinomycetota bacterium]MDK1027409.1 ABC transporter permease [Actinomycetota bacterium]MDK1037690.1 ABC transporter permease [Actinomycetota bacterium]MDK1096027.1 ABC transporter permease [Actinomycetota bacterium]